MEKLLIPEGNLGNWKVEKFKVSKEEADFINIRATFSFSDKGKFIKPGEYTRLMRNGTVVMSDTTSEMNDHRLPVYKAKGNILINGLGLGVVLYNCLLKDSVSHAFVVELDKDVIDLVSKWYINHFKNRMTIIHADAFEYKPPKSVRYQMVWHDIWDNICGDNYEEMKKLHRKYGRKCDWQGSWCQEETKRLK